jgi:hypothetical protein
MANKIQEITIQNFKGIDWKFEKLNGHHIILAGKNGVGKTSFIDAAVGNIKGIETPLKEGASKGLVRVEVDGYTIEHTFSKKNQKPKLSIYDKRGVLQGAPVNLFKELFGVQDFDIDSFLKLSPSKKVDFIKDIVGIDFTEMDKQYKELYQERTFLNRKVKEHDAKILNLPVVKDTEERDVQALSDVLSKIKVDNEKYDSFTIRLAQKQNERDELESKLFTLKNEIEKGQMWMNQKCRISITPHEQALSEAIEHNKSIALYTQYKKDREEGAENVNKVLEVESKMEEIQAIKKDELSAVDMPVKGLTFEEEGLYLDGLPFESNQINTARRIIAGLEIQYSLLGEVKISRIEGSLLDKNSLHEVIAWANSKDLQLFIEKVDMEGGELEIKIIES